MIPGSESAARPCALPLVEVRETAKKFCCDLRRSLWYGLGDLSRTVLGAGRRREALRAGEFWALRDVTFELRRGECLGVIGPNGAGKSTLLKMIQGRIRPDQGRITVRGRLAAITELGVGFDPVLSGRENIFTNAALLGFSKRRTDEILDAVIDFAALGEFIDAPVLTYSSGMRARLGFAVAAHLDPDVLLIDEVLAVGDVAFRRKCIRHMLRFLARGKSLIFVSHDLYTVQVLCSRALYLDGGKTVFLGEVSAAVAAYLEAQSPEGAAEPDPEESATFQAAPTEDRPVVIEGLDIEPVDADQLRTGVRARVTLRYHAARRFEAVPWGFVVTTSDLLVQVAVGKGALEEDARYLDPGRGTLTADVVDLPLLPGTYGLRAGITDPGHRTVLALFGYENPPTFFTVQPAGHEVDNYQRLSGALITLRTAAS